MKNSKSINIKSVLTKTFMAAGIAATGLTVANMNNNKAQAAVTSADPSVVTISATSVAVRSGASDYSPATGQLLNHATSWKVIDATNDAYGQRWYDLGKNQWVKASNTVAGYHTVTSYSASTSSSTKTTSTSSSQSSSSNSNSNYNYSTTNNSANYNYNNNSSSYSSSYSYSAPKTTYTSYNTSANTTASTTTTSTSSSSSEEAAKAWIANKESGGSYTATNGQYVGKYQLSASYLNGDYSAANQERVANNYVTSRYGSWAAAKSFWEANGWY